MTTLPTWFTISSTVITSTIAIAGFAIAGLQYLLLRRQYKANLYDRRLVIFNAIAGFIANLQIYGTPDHDDLIGLLRTTCEARFLFKPADQITQFIDDLYSKGLGLEFLNKQMDTDKPGYKHEELPKLLDKADVIKKWFRDQQTNLPERFSKYLRLT